MGSTPRRAVVRLVAPALTSAAHASRVAAVEAGSAGGHLTYGALHAQADRLAAFLGAAHPPTSAPSQARVALFAPNCIPVLTLHLAAAVAGAAIVNLNIQSTPSELAHMLALTAPRCVFAAPELLPTLLRLDEVSAGLLRAVVVLPGPASTPAPSDLVACTAALQQRGVTVRPYHSLVAPGAPSEERPLQERRSWASDAGGPSSLATPPLPPGPELPFQVPCPLTQRRHLMSARASLLTRATPRRPAGAYPLSPTPAVPGRYTSPRAPAAAPKPCRYPRATSLLTHTRASRRCAWVRAMCGSTPRPPTTSWMPLLYIASPPPAGGTCFCVASAPPRRCRASARRG